MNQLAAGLVGLSLFAGSLTSCSFSPPKRTAYTGADTVDTVDPSMFLGTWDVRILNPIEGEEDYSMVITYKEDGTMEANSEGGQEGMRMAFRMLGRWTIEGDVINQTMESIEETSGNSMAAFLKPILNSNKKNASGSANVYDSSADRLILVSVEQGQAQELTRR